VTDITKIGERFDIFFDVFGNTRFNAIKPIIHDGYPLDNIREAHAQQETKHTRGKISIRITA
jgi:NADPH:quinone reductase-like Zn-dependent oxidoreductase